MILIQRHQIIVNKDTSYLSKDKIIVNKDTWYLSKDIKLLLTKIHDTYPKTSNYC